MRSCRVNNQVLAPSSLLETHILDKLDETVSRSQNCVSWSQLPPQQKEPDDSSYYSSSMYTNLNQENDRVTCAYPTDQRTPPVEKYVKKIRKQALELYHLYTIHENQQKKAQKLERKLLKQKKVAQGLEERCKELRQMLETMSKVHRGENTVSKLQKLSFDLEHEKKKWSQARVKAQGVLMELEKYHQRVCEKNSGPKDTEDERAQYIQLLERVVHLKADELECSGHEELLLLLSSLRQTGYKQEMALDEAQREISALKQQKREVEQLNRQIDYLQSELNQKENTLVQTANERQRWRLDCESQNARLQELEAFNRSLSITVEEQRVREKKLIRRYQHTRKQSKVSCFQIQEFEQERNTTREQYEEKQQLFEMNSMRSIEGEQRLMQEHRLIQGRLDDYVNAVQSLESICHQQLIRYICQNGGDISPGLVMPFLKSLESIFDVHASTDSDSLASFNDRILAFVKNTINFCEEVYRVEASYSRESDSLRAAIAHLQQTVTLYELELAHRDEDPAISNLPLNAFKTEEECKRGHNIRHSYQLKQFEIQLVASQRLFVELSNYYSECLPAQHELRKQYALLNRENPSEMIQFFPQLVKAYIASCHCECSRPNFCERNVKASSDCSSEVPPCIQGNATPSIPYEAYTQDSIQPIGFQDFREAESDLDPLQDQINLVQQIFQAYKTQR
ncbi:hypothetical protein ABG067_005351 [Albugo candida]